MAAVFGGSEETARGQGARYNPFSPATAREVYRKSSPSVTRARVGMLGAPKATAADVKR